MGIQVQDLTQGKQPWDKEFIDFSFAGKHISEFGMVAVSDGDRHSLDMSPSFQDETSTVNGLNGQYYWGTTFDAGTISFKLATDGITEQQLAEMKRHFMPGKYGKLVLDERIGRYCYARVSSVITLNFIPFQEEKVIRDIKVNTNTYKGEAAITFKMDYPWWIGEDKYYSEVSETNLYKYLRNGIPFSFSNPTTTGIYVGSPTHYLVDGEAKLLSTYTTETSVEAQKVMKLYNCSEMDSPIKLTINNIPITTATYYENEKPGLYINSIRDSINTPSYHFQYDVYKVMLPDAGTKVSVLQYTSPSVIYNINKVIELTWRYKDITGANLVDFQDLLQEEIHHNRVLTWAMNGLRFVTNLAQYYDSSTGRFISGQTRTFIDYAGNVLTGHWYEYLNHWMLMFFAPATPGAGKNICLSYQANSVWDRDGTLGTFSLVIDGINTQSSVTYSAHSIQTTLTNLSNLQENCSEIVLSKYLYVGGGSCLDDNLNINTNSCYLLKKTRQGIDQVIDKANTIVEYRYLYL